MAGWPESRAARLARTKLDTFLDCLAQQIARKWLKEKREQGQYLGDPPDGESLAAAPTPGASEILIRESHHEDL